MKSRRVRRRRVVKIDIEVLAKCDPDFAATDAMLLELGYSRVKSSALYLTRSNQISGRVVWRKDGRSHIWASRPCHG